jgi:hypothetical protein
MKGEGSEKEDPGEVFGDATGLICTEVERLSRAARDGERERSDGV